MYIRFYVALLRQAVNDSKTNLIKWPSKRENGKGRQARPVEEFQKLQDSRVSENSEHSKCFQVVDKASKRDDKDKQLTPG